MNIRLLTEADAADFQALRLRGLAEAPQAFASSVEEEAGLPLAEVARRLAPREGAAVLGAFSAQGLLCGVAGIQRESMLKLRHKAFLWGMYVAPEAQRTGAGKALVAAALQHAWEVLGVAQVNLGVHAVNEPALRLYRSCGFEVFGLERHALCVQGQLQDEIHMVCHRVPPCP